MAKAKIKIDEPIRTHVPVSCTNSQKDRYNDLAQRLKDMGPGRKKLLNNEMRFALDKAMNKIESMIAAGVITTQKAV